MTEELWRESANAAFHTTRWSMVRAASALESPARRAALQELCTCYWSPLYFYVRRSGFSVEMARDLTQEFFARLLERNDFARADPERGRFRAYLRAALRHFLANEVDRQRSLKRAAEGSALALDFEGAEEAYRLVDRRELTPEESFERAWALGLLQRVLKLLEEEYRSRGLQELFAALAGSLTGADEAYAELARRLGQSEGSLKVAAHRLRARFRVLLRAEVAETLADPAELEDELLALQAALAR